MTGALPHGMRPLLPHDYKKQSKFLSYVLRHDPASIGLGLDPQGWTDIAAVLPHVPGGITRAELDDIVASSDKQRFAISPDGKRIRANQGHSVSIDLALAPSIPPDQLFHGTAERNLSAILSEGLNRQARHHVHLSSDVETARKVGMRHGKPVILIVEATAMAAAGHVFFRSDNGVWLVDHVPPNFLTPLT